MSVYFTNFMHKIEEAIKIKDYLTQRKNNKDQETNQ